MSSVPDTYWVLRESTEVNFFLGATEARRVCEELRDGIKEWVEFLDVCGGPCFVRSANIAYLYESTPTIRAMDHAISDAAKAERGFDAG